MDVTRELTQDVEEVEQWFYLDNSLDTDGSRFVAKVQLNFYQLWSMFMDLPCVYSSGKCKYEWKMLHNRTGAVFSIYDWNNRCSLLQTKTWYIGSTTSDDTVISEFLEVLCDAIECYNEYYKTAIETKTFTSTFPKVQSVLDTIKRSIIENRDSLRSL